MPGLKSTTCASCPKKWERVILPKIKRIAFSRSRILPPGEASEFPAKDVVDGGFLELVRYGIRAADDPIIVNTVKVIDAVLKVETDAGPGWHRYNHDGYGQKEDGGAFTGFGRGRVWPLLTGERGHYELAAGRSAETYVRAMEHFASPTGLLPEQAWDETDKPEAFMFRVSQQVPPCR